MRQFILPPSYTGEGELTLTGKESRYLTRVLRLKAGQQIVARSSTGATLVMTISSVSKDQCTLITVSAPITEAVQSEMLPAYNGPFAPLCLMQCLLKGRKEDELVRQATEIGATSITLVQSRHSIPDAKEKGQARIARLETKVREALQQSGSPIPTRLEPEIIDLSDLPAWWAGRGPALFFHQSDRGQQHTLTSLAQDLSIDEPIGILIGPEGGFSEDECTFLTDHGFIPVLLKTNILRSETAAIYALSALQTLLNERN